MIRRLRSHGRAAIDYALYVSAREWPLGIAGAGILIGVVTVLPSTVGIVLSVLALALGTATFSRDLRAMRRRWSSQHFVEISSPFPVDVLKPPLDGHAVAYVRIQERGTMLVDPAVDEMLRSVPIPISLTDPYRLPTVLHKLAPQMLRLIARDSLLFNGRVVGLATDPPATPDIRSPVLLRPTRYFDAMSSNELCRYRVLDRDSGTETDIRWSEVADPAGRCLRLAASRLANIIGISTLAMTSDNLLILVPQTELNAFSGRLFAPSGSGALELRDVQPGQTLQQVLIRGMEREMCEELGIVAAFIASTVILGYGRWMERGALPNFFALTRLRVTGSELASRSPDAAEQLYSGRARHVWVDLPKLGADLARGSEVAESQHCPASIRESGSVPLLMTLRAVAIYTHAAG